MHSKAKLTLLLILKSRNTLLSHYLLAMAFGLMSSWIYHFKKLWPITRSLKDVSLNIDTLIQMFNLFFKCFIIIWKILYITVHKLKLFGKYPVLKILFTLKQTTIMI